MRVSILMTYYNRRKLLINTLNSISKYIKDRDIEIIIIDDASDKTELIEDIPIVYSHLNIVIYRFEKDNKTWACPVIPANKGISLCTGDVVILQGAEIFHNGDIISDVLNRIKPNDYLVYGCFAFRHPNFDLTGDNQDYCTDENGVWYQHSIHSPRCFNFCTAIMREDLWDLGGFDERYARGTNYGDDDFILRVRRKGMNVIQIDNPYVYHQFHPWGKIVSNRGLYEYVLNYETNYRVKNSFLKQTKCQNI